MDQAMLSALIKSFGAADTPENTNRIREFYASDPKAAENRIYGTRSPSDESGGSRDMMLNAMLDKVIAQTAAPSQIQSEPLAPLPQTQALKAPQAAAPPQRGPRGAAPVMEPQMMPGYTDTTEITGGGTDGTGGGGDGFWPGLVALLLGGGATAKALLGTPPVTANASARGAGAGAEGSANRRLTGPDQNAKQLTYQPKLENNAPSTTRNSPELEAKGKAATDNYAKLNAEVEAENKSAKALQDQMMEMTRRQRNTADLAKAARRATGRK